MTVDQQTVGQPVDRPVVPPTGPITNFWGDHSFLSNFYHREFEYAGHIYQTAEHAFQSQKTLDEDWQSIIRLQPTAACAREQGRRCPLRPGWEDMKLAVMEDVLWAKFQDFELRQRLLGTGDRELVEGTLGSGRYWERCVTTGRGENWLGTLLMSVREALR